MHPVDPQRFDALVQQAIEGLPAWVRQHMQNIAILTAPWPTPEQRRASGASPGNLLLGLYEGIPLPRRSRGYHLQLPDRITLFQRPLEIVARDEPHLIALVRQTIIHEIAHHFGFSEEQLRKIEEEI